MKMWTYTLRELLRRPGRTLLTLAGIVIGVATGLLLPSNLAEVVGLNVGDTAQLTTPSPLLSAMTVPVPVVGILEPRGAALFNGGGIVFMPLSLAQKLFPFGGQFNNVQLLL